VLLAEDNRNLRVTTSRMLEHLGYAVTAVASGGEAVEAYRGAAERPDVVIADMMMPGMSGGDAVRAIRSLDPSARVIVCSGAEDDAERVAAEAGASGCLTKPYDLDKLAETLRRVLEA
jgi:two-component system chemotaxis response regulator CheY